MKTNETNIDQLLQAIREKCDSFLEDIEYVGLDSKGCPLFSAFDGVHKREIVIRAIENRLEADYGYGYDTVITTLEE
ncbi:hypothetical protein [Effusibacillus lacus]|uniref:Uncharacterized protein n=1 Tax=Effusibacillus lacus TaxID=1348429 RepID=A0A292YPU4_9BACL|nr:hypothetical protein [Effusibacillus lacus]TCS72504.1 hypothetical protein EDD64_1217 [Effusibacillus lacus]GAX90929.1 hypothetical protein EFBL_2571 [Effusibacillus lacus]